MIPLPGLTVISTMKNEGAFVLEWLAHYRALGAEHFLIAHNDCEDPLPAMLARLEELGLVRAHATRNWAHGGIQRTALRQARWYEEVTKARWIWVCDVDEFLTVHVGDGSFAALIDATPEAEVIAVNWRVFGSAGQTEYLETPVTKQFSRCETPPRLAYVKSLFAGLQRVGRIGIHCPHPREGSRLGAASAGGGLRWDDRARMMTRPDWTTAQVNHYALRGLHSFLVKRDRGRVNHAGEDMAADYWARFDLNAAEDHAIRRYDDAVAGELARLRADPELARLEAAARAWHRTRIADLLARPDWAAFARALSPAEV